jgi:serine/threonine protein phosphatase PrpC
VEDGAFCGVFDGHGKNGHIVSKIVCKRLPSLLLSQRNALARTYTEVNDNTFQNDIERIDGELRPSKNFHIWKEACISAFKLMDKEVQLQKKLDSSCSGTTAVVIIRQVKDQVVMNKLILYNFFHLFLNVCFLSIIEKLNRVKILL